MANNDCLPQVHACAIRVCKLESNGVPTVSATSLYTTDSFTKANYKPVYKDGADIEIVNACDSVALSYLGPASFKRGDFEIEIINQDPYLLAMLGGGDVLTTGGIHGFADPAIGPLGQRDISIELWAKRIFNGALHPDYPYMRHVFPRITNLRLGDSSFEAAAQIPKFSGQAVENPNWYNGPLNDWLPASNRVHQAFPVTSLPVSVCGPTAVAAS